MSTLALEQVWFIFTVLIWLYMTSFAERITVHRRLICSSDFGLLLGRDALPQFIMGIARTLLCFFSHQERVSSLSPKKPVFKVHRRSQLDLSSYSMIFVVVVETGTKLSVNNNKSAKKQTNENFVLSTYFELWLIYFTRNHEIYNMTSAMLHISLIEWRGLVLWKIILDWMYDFDL